ncbi:TonB-dependent receptor [Phenylobacterium sp. VNQ135]|uniref:TonB-dependent receptor n=1 Tax=Phenylobacterium sp. VNQ135 TaxID=3400922 RepID=UPI003C0A80D5
MRAMWLGGAALAAMAWPAYAQDNPVVEEVVVTAQKRAENIQDVPLSVSAYGADMIERAGVQNLQDLATRVPNLNIDASNNLRNTSVAIRGIGSSGSNPGVEPSVGVFLDGVYQPSGGMVQGELLDIASVEVLRGPQGTLYGRNTPVGALNITTQAPRRNPEAKIRWGVGGPSMIYGSGYVTGPLTDTLAGRLSFWGRKRGGYDRNLRTGERVNDFAGGGARARLLWEPNDTLTINLIGSYNEFSQECCVGEQIDPTGPLGIATPGFLTALAATGYPFRNYDDHDHVVDADDTGDDFVQQQDASLQIEKTLPSGHTLTSITAYGHWTNKVSISSDALPADIYRSPQRQENDVWSQELRIASPSDRRFTYMLGLFGYAQDLMFQQISVLGLGANRVFPATACAGVTPCRVKAGDGNISDFSQETRSWAAFGTATFNVTDRWSLTGGLRQSSDKKDAFINHYNLPGVSAAFLSTSRNNLIGDVSRKEDKLTWSANTKYDLTDAVMVFATAATGFKSGGFNSRRLAVGDPFAFGPENSTTYEAGVKSELLGRRLVLNATVFQMTLEDFQESVLNPVTGVGFIVGNAGEREVRGLEVDFRARPSTRLSIDGGFAYTDAEFTDRSAGPCAVGQTPNGTRPNTCNYDGLRPAGSPKWKGAVSAQYDQPVFGDLELSVRGEVNYTGAQYLNPTLDAASLQKAVTLVNLRATLGEPDGRWSASAWVKNLTDESYYSVVVTQPITAYTSGGGTAAARGFLGWYSAPRTWGADLTFRF